jgi:5-methyltetrahydrofolate--homocysteine methyltransferase
VQDYATRKVMEFEEAQRWLAPILNYVPAATSAIAAE